jgi:hypothetical protein
MDELVRLYSAEEKNIDFSFFLGIGVDNILDCTISINAIIRCGLDEAISEIVACENSKSFFHCVSYKFDQKSRFLIVHNIKDNATNVNYYEEIF